MSQADQGRPTRAATGKAVTQKRKATERQLEDAALALLARDGVLAGLNLQEVADNAGVNRGLVYTYFGSRQELLRGALARDVRSRVAEIASEDEQDVRHRFTERFRAIIRHSEAIRLLTLLLLDGDSQVRVVSMRDRNLADFDELVEHGYLPEGTDTTAHLVALNALAFGYCVYRDAYCKELGVDPDELDSRVVRVIGKILGTADAAGHAVRKQAAEDRPAPAAAGPSGGNGSGSTKSNGSAGGRRRKAT